MFFSMVGVAFLNMWRKFLDEGGLLTDWSSKSFDKDVLFFWPWIPKGIMKIELFVISDERGGSG